VVYRSVGWSAEAIPLYERTLADYERILGAAHPFTLTCQNNLGMAYQAAGRTAEAISLFERTAADCGRLLGTEHPATDAVRRNLAALTGQRGGRSRWYKRR
jgi:tetratricopeptide (TPR) repeat protein